MPDTNLYTIENEFLKVQINKTGAELYSLFHKPTNTEYLWQGDANYWASRAPVLFPIVGALKENTTFIGGKKYEIPKHGIVRKNEAIQVEQINPLKVAFTLTGGEAYEKIYPYNFLFSLEFSLDGNSLFVQFTVTNLDATDIYFSMGGHPAFRCPLNEGESYEDYVLEFESVEDFVSSRLNADGLLLEQKDEIAMNTATLPLRPDMFDKDALIFTDLRSRKVMLKKHSGEKVLSVSYPDFPHLGLWAKPGAPFLCIEPWIGYNDATDTNQIFEKKPGTVKLEASKTFKAHFYISIDA